MSLDRKPKVVKPPVSIADLLAKLAKLRMQMPNFFVKERGLCGQGLNSKLTANMACTTPNKIEEVWGKCKSFKMTNTTLDLESRQELTQLCRKIYGKAGVTNNEFMAWVVKRYFAERMSFLVDWTSVAASTAFVLASQLEGKILKHDLSPEEGAELLCLVPHAATKPSGTLSILLATIVMDRKSSPRLASIPHKPRVLWVLLMDIATVEKVLKVEAELLSNTESKE